MFCAKAGGHRNTGRPRRSNITNRNGGERFRRLLLNRTNPLMPNNTGRPARMAALPENREAPTIQTKGGCGLSLSPALVPGGAKPHRASQLSPTPQGGNTPQGLPPHRLVAVLPVSGWMGGSRSRKHQSVLSFRRPPLAALHSFHRQRAAFFAPNGRTE